MNALDCLVHPAIGLVICEAHACGQPVIANALDGIPEAFVVGAVVVWQPLNKRMQWWRR